MKKFYNVAAASTGRPHFPRRRRGHRPPSTMPPHGSAKKKKKGRDGTGKKKSRAGGARDHGRASSGVGGGSSLENLIDSGNEHLAMDRVEEGLNDLRKACALVPDSADAWDAYGMALAEFGAPDDAIKVLKRAAQLSPNIGYEKVSLFLSTYGQLE